MRTIPCQTESPAFWREIVAAGGTISRQKPIGRAAAKRPARAAQPVGRLGGSMARPFDGQKRVSACSASV
jgi:hypothetical protein